MELYTPTKNKKKNKLKSILKSASKKLKGKEIANETNRKIEKQKSEPSKPGSNPFAFRSMGLGMGMGLSRGISMNGISVFSALNPGLPLSEVLEREKEAENYHKSEVLHNSLLPVHSTPTIPTPLTIQTSVPQPKSEIFEPSDAPLDHSPDNNYSTKKFSSSKSPLIQTGSTSQSIETDAALISTEPHYMSSSRIDLSDPIPLAQLSIDDERTMLLQMYPDEVVTSSKTNSNKDSSRINATFVASSIPNGGATENNAQGAVIDEDQYEYEYEDEDEDYHNDIPSINSDLVDTGGDIGHECEVELDHWSIYHNDEIEDQFAGSNDHYGLECLKSFNASDDYWSLEGNPLSIVSSLKTPPLNDLHSTKRFNGKEPRLSLKTTPFDGHPRFPRGEIQISESVDVDDRSAVESYESALPSDGEVESKKCFNDIDLTAVDDSCLNESTPDLLIDLMKSPPNVDIVEILNVRIEEATLPCSTIGLESAPIVTIEKASSIGSISVPELMDTAGSSCCEMEQNPLATLLTTEGARQLIELEQSSQPTSTELDSAASRIEELQPVSDSQIIIASREALTNDSIHNAGVDSLDYIDESKCTVLELHVVQAPSEQASRKLDSTGDIIEGSQFTKDVESGTREVMASNSVQNTCVDYCDSMESLEPTEGDSQRYEMSEIQNEINVLPTTLHSEEASRKLDSTGDTTVSVIEGSQDTNDAQSASNSVQNTCVDCCDSMESLEAKEGESQRYEVPEVHVINVLPTALLSEQVSNSTGSESLAAESGIPEALASNSVQIGDNECPDLHEQPLDLDETNVIGVPCESDSRPVDPCSVQVDSPQLSPIMIIENYFSDNADEAIVVPRETSNAFVAANSREDTIQQQHSNTQVDNLPVNSATVVNESDATHDTSPTAATSLDEAHPAGMCCTCAIF